MVMNDTAIVHKILSDEIGFCDFLHTFLFMQPFAIFVLQYFGGPCNSFVKLLGKTSSATPVK